MISASASSSSKDLARLGFCCLWGATAADLANLLNCIRMLAFTLASFVAVAFSMCLMTFPTVSLRDGGSSEMGRTKPRLRERVATLATEDSRGAGLATLGSLEGP